MYAIVWVFLGGALGGLLRYSVSLLANRCLGSRFPWGTGLVNLTGAGLLGIWVGWHYPIEAIQSTVLPGGLLFTVGLLGSYTTVSSFSLQTLSLIQAERWLAALTNSLVSLLGCPLLFLLGYLLAAPPSLSILS